MYLKELKTVGFKSFADPIKIDFRNGITGIVGPNGSGKSNVVDAIRWVLGEQSVKSLRGEGAMSDVIFSGSKSRSPLNKASVTVVLDNKDKYFNSEYTEISISRRMYRDGENEYLLNGDKCRLKDITDILMDTGISKESFNIISQGEVQEILSSKPVERRVIFEEAAGVLKYKKRKEMAIRKLERTHDNLKRVTDIITELSVQVEPLKEQSIKASEYLKNKKELENIELALIAEDIESINHDYEINKKKIEELKNEIINLETNYSGHEGEIERLKLELNKSENVISEKQRELVSITEEVEKLNNRKQLTNERQKYQVEDSKVHNQIIVLKEDELKYNNDINLKNQDIANDQKQLIELNEIITKLENNILKIKEEREALDKNLDVLAKKKTELVYRERILESSIENNELLPSGVKSLLNNPLFKGLHNVIGNLINVEEEYALAIETALGSAMQFLVTDDEIWAKKAINYLKENNLGKATFFPLNIIKPKGIDYETENIAKKHPAFIDIAANLVTFDNNYRNIIFNQLGNVIVAKDIDGANEISKLTNHKVRIVTLDGELIHVGGSLTGGRYKNNRSSMIKEKYELDHIKRNISELNSLIEKHEKQLEEFIYNYKELETKLYSKKIDKVNMEEIINSKIKLREELLKRLEDIKSELEDLNNLGKNNIDKEELDIMTSYYKSLEEKESLAKEIEVLNQTRNKLQYELDELEADLKKNNVSYNKKQNELKELEISINRMEVKLDNYLNTLNEEYSMTFEKAKENYKLDIDKEEARIKVNSLKSIIKSLGIVNIGAIEEYERVNKRYTFLTKQKDDLLKAEEMLLEIIKEMDNIMKDKFKMTFENIQREFKIVFKELFRGGSAELKLTEPNNLLETGIEIIAEPPGKKLQHLNLLSGGEKALTAISLLFAILKAKPVPFSILDEVEAALDEANVKYFGEYLSKFKDKTQFIVITHKKKTMEYADTLYGITMQESGVSKFVSVKLEDIK